MGIQLYIQTCAPLCTQNANDTCPDLLLNYTQRFIKGLQINRHNKVTHAIVVAPSITKSHPQSHTSEHWHKQ